MAGSSSTLDLTTVDFEVVIGLEVHVQLKTATKLFSSAPNHFGDAPNLNTTALCMALPGTLPVLNAAALEAAIRIGLALGSTIAPVTKFDRKQYFYPDLPKGYQISQYDQPICSGGELVLPSGKAVRITRAHLEEDAGKLVHAGAEGLSGSTHSLVDLNRAGTPLVEIVSEPDITSAEEARDYMVTLRNLVRYLGVCDGNLEEGSMRCDANVSLRPVGQKAFGTRTETKNMNSFRAIERAIKSEIIRQEEILRAGGHIVQETRLWNEATGTTVSMRGKEAAHDYRYFPEPDLPPFRVDAAWVAELAQTQPELPKERENRLQSQFGLSAYDAGVLVEFKEQGDFFLAALNNEPSPQNQTLAKTVANLLMGDITGWLKAQQKTLPETALTPKALLQLAQLLEAGTVSSAIAKQLLPDLLTEGGMPEALVASKGLSAVSDTGELQALIAEILAANAGQVAAYKSGKTKLFGFFVGQLMQKTQGRANPAIFTPLLEAALAGEG